MWSSKDAKFKPAKLACNFYGKTNVDRSQNTTNHQTHLQNIQRKTDNNDYIQFYCQCVETYPVCYLWMNNVRAVCIFSPKHSTLNVLHVHYIRWLKKYSIGQNAILWLLKCKVMATEILYSKSSTVNVNFLIIARYHTELLMRSVHQVLLKTLWVQQATKASDVEEWIAQIVAQWVPRHRTNHGECTTAVCLKFGY